MFDKAIADEVCRRLSLGETLRQICKTQGFPTGPTICKWANERPDFATKYARARAEGLDAIAEEMVEIADDPDDDPNSRRVKVDTRKWLLSKLRPDKYGDRQALEHSGPGGQTLKVIIEDSATAEDKTDS